MVELKGFLGLRRLKKLNELNVCFCLRLRTCVCVRVCDGGDDLGHGGDVMYYGVYMSQVVCNFSPGHWLLPAHSWKRHLASCAVAG